MWTYRKRRKRWKIEWSAVLPRGIFYSKFRFKLNPVFLQLNEKYAILHRAEPPGGCFCLTVDVTESKIFQPRTRVCSKIVSKYRSSLWKAPFCQGSLQ